MFPALRRYIEGLLPELASIPDARRGPLDQLARYVSSQRAAGQPARLVFICTHNSRRSHIAQLWAALAAAWYERSGVETYSGGTEATTFNPRAVAAMRRAGLAIEATEGGGDNPRYTVRFGPDDAKMTVWSKIWSDDHNPRDHFAAVMTCGEADAACPHVPGASSRISLPYEDPKAADGTSAEARAYDERTRQIAIEMFYVLEGAAS